MALSSCGGQAAAADAAAVPATIPSSATPASGDAALKFCDALVSASGGYAHLMAMEELAPDDLAKAGDKLSAAVKSAPADIASAASTVAQNTLQQTHGVSWGAGSGFVDAATSLVSWMKAHCGFRALALSGTDTLLDGVPATLSAGPLAITFDNHGSFMPIVMVGRINDDVHETAEQIAKTSTDPATAHDDKGSRALLFRKVTMTGAVSADAKARGFGFVDLKPGRYLFVLSDFRKAEVVLSALEVLVS